MQQFIDNSFEHISSTEQSLTLLTKFSQIKDMQLDLESKYHAIFIHYTRRDLEGVRKLYLKFKDSPPIPRNTPPVSGSIAWARQLYRRIEGPMRIFKANTKILDSADAKKPIKNYNKLARTLMEFELLWYRSWYNIVEQAKSALQATLLVTDSQGNLFVNFDSQIIQLIKETRCMQRLSLDVPESARQLCQREDSLKTSFLKLNNILQKKKQVIERLPVHLRKAIAPHIEKLNAALEPGLTSLNWYEVDATERRNLIFC